MCKFLGRTLHSYNYTEPNPIPGNPVNMRYVHNLIGSSPIMSRLGMEDEIVNVDSELYYPNALDRQLAASLQFMRNIEKMMNNMQV